MRLFPSGFVARRRREGTDPVSSLHRHRMAVPRNFGLRHRSPYCPRVSVLGATLAWVGRKHEKLVAVQQEIAEAGGNASIHICDIREEDQVRATVEAILKKPAAASTTSSTTPAVNSHAAGKDQRQGLGHGGAQQPHRRFFVCARTLHALDEGAARRGRGSATSPKPPRWNGRRSA